MFHLKAIIDFYRFTDLIEINVEICYRCFFLKMLVGRFGNICNMILHHFIGFITKCTSYFLSLGIEQNGIMLNLPKNEKKMFSHTGN